MKKRNNEIVISCPIKNENEYLIEFTEHYLNLGFDSVLTQQKVVTMKKL
jgi:hypothetical protein